jgi:hypothetical protein
LPTYELFSQSAVCLQVLQYNHASLELWGSDTLLLIVDLDEYLITPRPMSAVQVHVLTYDVPIAS